MDPDRRAIAGASSWIRRLAIGKSLPGSGGCEPPRWGRIRLRWPATTPFGTRQVDDDPPNPTRTADTGVLYRGATTRTQDIRLTFDDHCPNRRPTGLLLAPRPTSACPWGVADIGSPSATVWER